MNSNKIAQFESIIQNTNHNIFSVRESVNSIVQLLGFQTLDLPSYLPVEKTDLKFYTLDKSFNSSPYSTTVNQNYKDSNIHFKLSQVKNINKASIESVCIDKSLDSKQYQKSKVSHRKNNEYLRTLIYDFNFIVNQECDKLVLAINTNNQLITVEFKLGSNHKLSITKKDKILPNIFTAFANVKDREINLEFLSSSLNKACSIKEVNKEFYQSIYNRFISIAPENSNDKQKQFAIRLIGRLVFCWFLREKGIIPTTLLNSDVINTKNNFYQDVLLDLFFSVFNTPVNERGVNNSSLSDELSILPFLNGGLFEQHEEDLTFANLITNEWLTELFTSVFESYDFTVDESTSSYQQVAIDPEMLGRIFENLLASQNKETSKAANERKNKGAFYTPRDIVEFMINQTLKDYLQTKINTKNNKTLEGELNSFIEGWIPSATWVKDNKEIIKEALIDIKIIDPTCGSGAFPMSILQKLTEIYQSLDTSGKINLYETKKSILANNIYGVDIMPMAAEITRLRAWLSLILEQTYDPTGTANNFGIDPMPNLDFKFVCANSLILINKDDFSEVKNKVKFEANKDSFNLLNENVIEDSKVTVLKEELLKRRQEYFTAINKVELKKEYLQLLSELKNQSESIKEYNPIDSLRIANWNPFDTSKPAQFYDNLWMFGLENGFDIVIGNPPYYQIQKIKPEASKKELKEEKYSTYQATGDLYCLFYEQASKILKQDGLLCFITSNKWMRSGYGQSTRQFLTSNVNTKLVIDLGGDIFESATVDTNILIYSNTAYSGSTRTLNLIKPRQNQTLTPILQQLNNEPNYNTFNAKGWSIGNDIETQLLAKIERLSKPLKEWDVKINYGIKTGLNDAFIIDKATKDRLIKEDPKSAEIIKPILRGKDIKKYGYEFKEKYLIVSKASYKENDINYPCTNIPKDYPAIYQHIKKFERDARKRSDQGDSWYNLRKCAYYKDFEKEKIVYGEISTESAFKLVDGTYYLSNTGYIMTGRNLLYILAILNSKTNQFIFKKYYSTQLGKNFRYLAKDIIKLPIPYIEETDKTYIKIITIAKLLNSKNKNILDANLINELELLIHKVYQLTDEEISFISTN